MICSLLEDHTLEMFSNSHINVVVGGFNALGEKTGPTLSTCAHLWLRSSCLRCNDLYVWCFYFSPESSWTSFLCRSTSSKNLSSLRISEFHQRRICFLSMTKIKRHRGKLKDVCWKVVVMVEPVFDSPSVCSVWPRRLNTQPTPPSWPRWSPPAWGRSAASSPAPACRNRFVTLSSSQGEVPLVPE